MWCVVACSGVWQRVVAEKEIHESHCKIKHAEKHARSNTHCHRSERVLVSTHPPRHKNERTGRLPFSSRHTSVGTRFTPTVFLSRTPIPAIVLLCATRHMYHMASLIRSEDSDLIKFNLHSSNRRQLRKHFDFLFVGCKRIGRRE